MTTWATMVLAHLQTTQYANNTDVLGKLAELDETIGEQDTPQAWAEAVESQLPPGADKELLEILQLIKQILLMQDAVCLMTQAIVSIALGFLVDLGCDE